jgi:CRISPR-associated protein Csd2
MTTLQNKIDFSVVFRVKRANPNGDPLNGNRPRTDYDNYGEVTDVCIKRKIRDRLLERWVADGKKDDGNMIFVQSDDRKADEHKSLRLRAEDKADGLGKEAFKKSADRDATAKAACAKWFDVRAFGQVFAFSKGDDASGVSIPIRGPVTVQSAFSVEPVDVASIQITKSASGEGDGSKRGSDTMGMKHRVDKGVYVFFGSMNAQLAEKTGFSVADAEAIKAVLPRLFENDESSARPAGSMEVLNVLWWQHNSKLGQHSSAKVHKSLTVNADGTMDVAELEGLEPELIKGF